jgi:hypothetical protein
MADKLLIPGTLFFEKNGAWFELIIAVDKESHTITWYHKGPTFSSIFSMPIPVTEDHLQKFDHINYMSKMFHGHGER